MASVTIAQVKKRFGAVEILHGVDIAIADGSFTVLVGPSGCGKSTLLRMIAGLEQISDGEVRIGAQRVNDLPPKQRDIAMVFQNYALYPHMSVRENMGFALEVAKVGKPEIKSRVEKAASILGLSDLLDRKPKALSGGQRQRVAMGRAIVREPSVFLMDEPLSNLDAKLRVQMRAEIIRLQRELATTMVYVTHDQIEAMTMGDRVAVMRKGVLQQVSSPQELYERPDNLFVAGFIGSPAMNFVTATLERAGDRFGVLIGAQRLMLDPAVMERHPRAAALAGGEVVLGLRPEHFGLPEDSVSPADQRLDILVDLAEAMGAETHVHFSLPVPPVQFEGSTVAADDDAVSSDSNLTTKLIARLEGTVRAAAGELMTLGVRTGRAHLFDPVSGLPLR